MTDPHEHSDAEIDRRFDEIVAGIRADPPPGRDQHLPDDDGAHDEGTEQEQVDGQDQPDPGPAAPPTEQAGWRQWDDPEVEEHFIPDPPPPLPAGDLHFWAILGGLLGGPLLLLLTALPVLDRPLWGWLGVALTVGGFVLLVLRSPRRRSEDDGPGAVV